MKHFRKLFCVSFTATIALLGCDAIRDASENDGMRTARRWVRAIETLCDTLASITDAESAKAAMPTLADTFQEYSDSAVAVTRYDNEHGQIRGMKESVAELERETDNATNRLANEIRRLVRTKGLPEAFWQIYRRESLMAQVTMYDGGVACGFTTEEADNLHLKRDMIVDHGPSKVVDVRINGFSPRINRQSVVDKFKAILETDASVLHYENLDYEGAVDLVVAPTYRFDRLLDVAKELGDVTFHERPKRIIVFTIDASKISPPQRSAETQAERAASTFERMTNIQPDSTTRNTDSESVAGRFESERRAREIASRFSRKDSELSEAELESLIDALEDEDSFEHDEATKTLSRLKPTKVKKKKHRQRIARAFRDAVIYAEFMRLESVDVEGLQNWAGKHSIPVLVDRMEETKIKVPDEIFNALAKYPTSEGANAAAGFLGNFFNHQAAVKCLRRMGPVAEKALMTVAPTNNPDASYAAIRLLGEYGTEECISLLRRAVQSSNPRIQMAARSALQAVKERTEE